MGKTPCRNIIGPACVKLREKQGYTQEQFSARCTVAGLILTRGSYAKIESQERQVTDYEIVQLARVFRVDIAELLPSSTKVPTWAKHRKKRATDE